MNPAKYQYNKQQSTAKQETQLINRFSKFKIAQNLNSNSNNNDLRYNLSGGHSQ